MAYNHKMALDVRKNPKTVTHEPSFYTDFLEKHKKPFVRVTAPADKRFKKDHQESKLFGLVCVHYSCNHGDVHRHPDDEVQLIKELAG